MIPIQRSFRHATKTVHSYVCWSCQQKREIATSVRKRQERARKRWDDWAHDIKAGQRKTVLQNIEERGLIHSMTGERQVLEKLLTEKRVGVYTGIDPTASSLHVGHMLPLMALFWMYLQGCHSVALIGGATAKIGDPTGRQTARTPMTPTERKSNMVSLHYQVKKLWNNAETVAKRYGWEQEEFHPEDRHRELVNNNTWWNALPFVDVLKYLGSGIRLGPMLGRDTVKNKMENGDGMSFAEFSYPILQAWDWWQLYSTKNVQMQIGGADQYGNIVAGIDAIKYLKKTHPDPLFRAPDGVLLETELPYGFTVPLLTTATGEKFGKSAGNAVWLDESYTSLFDLYGFFVGTPDADVERYLKFFTFMPLRQIQSTMDKHRTDLSKRIAQHTLAYEFVWIVHGEQAADRAKQQHMKLFQKKSISGILEDLQRDADSTAEAPLTQETTPATDPSNASNSPNPWSDHNSLRKREASTFENVSLNPHAADVTQHNTLPAHMVLPRSLIDNQPIARVLYSAGLVSSRSEGHRLALNKGAYIGSRSSKTMSDDLTFVPVKLADPTLTWRAIIRDQKGSAAGMEKEGEEGLLILRVGKWKVRIIRVVTDELFRKLVAEGQAAPSTWTDFEAQRVEEEWLRKSYEDGAGMRGAEWRYASGVGTGDNESGMIKYRGTSRAQPPRGSMDVEDSEDFGDEQFEPHQHIKRRDHRKEIAKGRKEGWEYLTSLENDPDGVSARDQSEEDWVESMKRGNGALGDGARLDRHRNDRTQNGHFKRAAASAGQ